MPRRSGDISSDSWLNNLYNTSWHKWSASSVCYFIWIYELVWPISRKINANRLWFHSKTIRFLSNIVLAHVNVFTNILWFHSVSLRMCALVIYQLASYFKLIAAYAQIHYANSTISEVYARHFFLHTLHLSNRIAIKRRWKKQITWHIFQLVMQIKMQNNYCNRCFQESLSRLKNELCLIASICIIF